jgi:hypothetical protein
MKKFLVVLLSLGLIVAFCATASAVDVKFGGAYYVTGVYENNYSLGDTDNKVARALFHQRARLEPVFQIAEGLSFTARMDFLEKNWGDTTWLRATNTTGIAQTQFDQPSNRQSQGVAGRYAQESVEWERAYMTFNTAAGTFQVGYQSADAWGTLFGDSETTRPRIMFSRAFGPLTMLAIYEKWYEADGQTFANGSTINHADADGDTYSLAGIYKIKAGEVGLLAKYYNLAQFRALTATATVSPYKTSVYQLAPYTKLTFGPAYVEAEVNYFFGKWAQYEDGSGRTDVDEQGLTAYIHGKYNIGPAYVGALAAYMSGNDPADATKDKIFSGGGTSWSPALMLANDDLYYYMSWNNAGLANGTGLSTSKKNMILYSLYGGFNPTPKLNLETNLTMASTAKAPRNTTLSTDYDSNYGTEIDLKATYKLYDNLSYMVGAGYLWTGDYFKYGVSTNKVGNDYLLINKLTLSF